jgi:DNA polymerase III alpha subunit
VEALILADAFDPLGERQQLLRDLAEALEIAKRPRQRALLDVPDERADLAPMPADQKLALTFATTGVTAGPHLVELHRDAFTRAGCLTYPELRNRKIGAKVRVGGLVLDTPAAYGGGQGVADGLRRPPTANGTAFLRLDTPSGLIDAIIPVWVYAECRQALRSAFVVVDGELQRVAPTPSVLATSVRAL